MSRGCTDYERTSRRTILRAGFAGLAGLHLPALLRAESTSRARPAKHVIFLHQFGGPSHIDTFDMKPDAPDAFRGEFAPISSAVPGLQVCEHLPGMAKVMDRVAVVRSVHHGMKNHNSATYYSLTGHVPPIDDIRLRDTQELFPAYGSIAARFRPADDPAVPSFAAFPHVMRDGSVTPGQHASFLGKAHDPFFVGIDPNRERFRLPELTLPSSLPADRLGDRRSLQALIDRQSGLLEWDETAQGIDSFYDRALTMLTSDRVRDAFDLSAEPESLRDRYGRTTYGQSCLLARRLVEAGVRFVSVYFSRAIAGPGQGWDTHEDNFRQLKDYLLPLTDQVVPALLLDLESRGLLEETLVVWMGEFGRAPKIGDRDAKGRNHWPNCYSVLLAGGGVRGGAMYGSSDRVGAYPATDPVQPDHLAATMFWALGIDPATEIRDPLGRPFPIATCPPITSLFA